MGSIELLSIALTLSIDAAIVCLAASAVRKPSLTGALYVSGVLALFHAVMPLIGVALGYSFVDSLSGYSHYIGFALLLFVGLKMLRDSLSSDEGEVENILNPGTLIVLALATSIDALVIGFTFIFVEVNVPLAIALIGSITFAAGLLGMYLGNKGTLVLGNRVQSVGALVLIALAFKILLFP